MSAAPACTAEMLGKRLLRADERMQAYFATPLARHGALLMTCHADDTFNLATIDDVPPPTAEEALEGIIEHFRGMGGTPRIRLSPCSHPDWPGRLAAAEFHETGERRRFWLVPAGVEVNAPPGVNVARITEPDDIDRFSAIQMFAFQVPEPLHEWDRQMARSGLAAGAMRYFLGRTGTCAVAAGAVMPLSDHVAGLWGLATLPAARGHGVARAMLRELIADARALSCDPIFFTTAWDNPMELAYRRMGFVPLFRTRTFALTR